MARALLQQAFEILGKPDLATAWFKQRHDLCNAIHKELAKPEQPDPWLQQALKQAYEYGKVDGLKQRHTEAEVQRILSCVTRVIGPDGQIFADLTATVRDVLGVPA
jgi:hypothetical protein